MVFWSSLPNTDTQTTIDEKQHGIFILVRRRKKSWGSAHAEHDEKSVVTPIFVLLNHTWLGTANFDALPVPYLQALFAAQYTLEY